VARADSAQILGDSSRSMSTLHAIIDAQTSLAPILAALEHIEAHGSLLSFTRDHAQRVQLMKQMTEIELVAWNAVAKRYELTPFGYQCISA
jgi:hypothetical protein